MRRDRVHSNKRLDETYGVYFSYRPDVLERRYQEGAPEDLIRNEFEQWFVQAHPGHAEEGCRDSFKEFVEVDGWQPWVDRFNKTWNREHEDMKRVPKRRIQS
jgi:hypothetical protein